MKNQRSVEEKRMKNQRSEEGSNANWLGGFLVGFLSGGLLGAVVMLLQAPNTGKQTRSKIQKKGAKLRRQATEGIEDVVTEASDMAHQFTDDVQANINKGTESVHKGVGELQQRGQELLAEAKK